MIKNFNDKQLENCWRKGNCKGIRQDLIRRMLMKLDSMDAANTLADLRNPPSNHLHSLKGEYEGYWAISINGSWRLIFKLINNDIYEIMLIQYH